MSARGRRRTDWVRNSGRMIGSGELDVDGVFKDGKREPLMRKGEWVA